MRKQIPLLLEQSIKYSAENFHLHAGIKPILKAIGVAAQKQGFSIFLVVGGRHSGKTHLGVHCAECTNATDRTTLWVEGSEVSGWWDSHASDDDIPWKSAIVIDDAHKIFDALKKGRSAAPLIDFIERCRRRRVLLILLSAKALTDYKFDAQVTGRIKASSIFEIGDPAEKELDTLLDLIACQRAVRLTAYKRGFLLKRVPRTIAALVDCLTRLEEKTASERKSTTALSHLAEAVPATVTIVNGDNIKGT